MDMFNTIRIYSSWTGASAQVSTARLEQVTINSVEDWLQLFARMAERSWPNRPRWMRDMDDGYAISYTSFSWPQGTTPLLGLGGAFALMGTVKTPEGEPSAAYPYDDYLLGPGSCASPVWTLHPEDFGKVPSFWCVKEVVTAGRDMRDTAYVLAPQLPLREVLERIKLLDHIRDLVQER